MRGTDRNSNSSNTDSPSDFYTSPLQRPRRLALNSTSSTTPNTDVGESYNAEFEHLPVLSAIRDKVAAEAEAVMNQAVEQSLNVSYSLELSRIVKIGLIELCNWACRKSLNLLINRNHCILQLKCSGIFNVVSIV